MWLPNHALTCAKRLSHADRRYEEAWWPLEAHPGYLVSSEGRVYSARRDEIMRASEAPNGRLRVTLSSEGRSYICYVHRLVAEAFLDVFDGDPAFEQVGSSHKARMDVRHIDGDFHNNSVENLEWVPRGTRMGQSFDHMGSQHNASRRVRVVETGQIFESLGECARHFRISTATLRRLMKSESESNGLHFEEIR